MHILPKIFKISSQIHYTLIGYPLLYLISFILQEENYEIQNPEDIFLFLYFMKN